MRKPTAVLADIVVLDRHHNVLARMPDTWPNGTGYHRGMMVCRTGRIAAVRLRLSNGICVHWPARCIAMPTRDVCEGEILAFSTLTLENAVGRIDLLDSTRKRKRAKR